MVIRGALGSLLVLVGGLVISVLPESSPVGRLPLVETLRSSMPGRMVGLVVVVAGLGLLSAAWLQLLRFAARTGTHTAADRLDVVRRACVVWCAPLLLAPPMFSRDGWSYAAQGVMTRLGLSPYEWGPSILHGPVVEAVDPMWMHTITPYGPLPLLWGSLAAGLTDDPWLLVVAHRGLGLLGLGLLGYAVPRLARIGGRDPARASALVLCSPVMLAHGVAGLHNDLLMAGLMATALVVAAERGWVLAAVLGGAAAAVKVPGGLVCIGVALVGLPLVAGQGQRIRRLAAVAGVAVTTILGLGLVAHLGVGWINALGVPGEVRTPLSLTTQLGRLLAVLPGSGGSDTTVAVTRGLGSVATLGFACWTALRGPTGSVQRAVVGMAWLMSAVVLLSPVVHHWYALWCLPLLAVCTLGERVDSCVWVLSLLLGLVAPLDSTLRGTPAVVVVTSILIGGVAAVLIRTHRAALVRPWPSRPATAGALRLDG